MSTSAATLPSESRALPVSQPISLSNRTARAGIAAILTVAAIGIEGYHPYAEDGGLYAAGVERLLDPSLFPHWTAFVLAPMRISLFAPTLAALVRLTHLTFPSVLLLVHMGTMFATLLAAYCLAEQCWPSRPARVGATLLVACWIGLPVAGTSLQIMDPYITARSFSTPCTLFALLAVLKFTATSADGKRSRWLVACILALTLGCAMHPLMTAYAIAATCLLMFFRSRRPVVRWAGTTGCCALGIGVAAALQRFSPPESKAFLAAALTRTYWFPQQWSWYELVGLAAPIALVALCTSARIHSSYSEPAKRNCASAALGWTAMALGSTAILVALLYAKPAATTHLVARLQPLRAFQTVYIVMILMLGALLGEYVLRRSTIRWIAAVAVLGTPVFLASRATFASSSHIQIASAKDSNPWVQSFVWVRTHTPKDALFALEPDYIHAPGEEGQCFRAIAERSVLPDYSKDGGEASIAPQLADLWQAGVLAQQNAKPYFELLHDSSQTATLRSLGVSWVILRSASHTDLDCPFSNHAAKVCRVS